MSSSMRRTPGALAAWIAATAMRHGVAIVTQDADFPSFDEVPVLHA